MATSGDDTEPGEATTGAEGAAGEDSGAAEATEREGVATSGDETEPGEVTMGIEGATDGAEAPEDSITDGIPLARDDAELCAAGVDTTADDPIICVETYVGQLELGHGDVSVTRLVTYEDSWVVDIVGLSEAGVEGGVIGAGAFDTTADEPIVWVVT